MRVSSLSDKKVIDLVSAYFFPVWLSRDQYQVEPRSRAEQNELLRIDRERKDRRLEGGSVSLTIVAPDGSVMDSMRVQRACKPELLVPFLQTIVARERLKPRPVEQIQKESPPSRLVKAKSDGGLVLHICTRFEGQRANYGLSEDWLELTPAEWATFAAPANARKGDQWSVSEKVQDRIFRYFYPPGPNWRVQDSQVLRRSLKATLTETSGEELVIALHGSLELSHPFGGKDRPGTVTGKLVGVLRYHAMRRGITSFVMISEEANYVWQWQGKPQPEKMVIAVERTE